MLNVLMLGVAVLGPNESEVYKNRWPLEVVLMNEKTAEKYVKGLNYNGGVFDYTYNSDPDPWIEYLRKSTPEMFFMEFEEDARWRAACWINLAGYLRSPENENGINDYYQRRYHLSRLRELLGRARFEAGWMPCAIPQVNQHYVGWLQALWTPQLGFQGSLNNTLGKGPLESYKD